MKQRRLLSRMIGRGRWIGRGKPTWIGRGKPTPLLVLVLLAGVIIVPAVGKVHAAGNIAQHDVLSRATSATPVNATIYLTMPMLESLFQQNIAQQVPGAFNSAIDGALNKLPAQDRGWAQQMIAALIQPGAVLTGLTTQQNGLAMSLRVTLYSGDPKPINSSMLITFKVINASSVQVSAQSLNGGPALANGPIATFQVPLGQLSSINTTPACGSAALAVHLQVPLALSQGQASVQLQPGQVTAMSQQIGRQKTDRQARQTTPNNLPASANAFVEIPASSLAQLGNSIGTMPISSGLTAQNIQVGVQGSNLVVNADIYSSIFGNIGTAVTTMKPTASNGGLAVIVTNTTFNILNIIPISENGYNQQIQQTLDSKLSGAFTGKFDVTQAQIGPNGSVPCAASSSLILSGSTSLG